MSLSHLFKRTLLAFLMTCAAASSIFASTDFDYVIRGASVFDGVSKPRQADVGISGGRIGAVGNLSGRTAKQIIDGQGLYLVPGFIDAHTHSDFNELVYPELANKIFQGVTTEVTGNCGMSAAPLEGGMTNEVRSVWAREGVVLPEKFAWTDFAGYRAYLEKEGLKTNLRALVGHGNLRYAVMGGENRPASVEEIRAMAAMLEKAIREGAGGISFGLVYLPGIFAKEEEILALCRKSAEADGICAFHMRSEGGRLLESIDEVIRIGEASGARIQISHLKAAGPANWSKIGDAFRRIEEARARGVEIRADAYPYTASFAELGVVLPDSLFERPDRLALFQDPSRRASLVAELQAYYRSHPRDWSKIMVASVREESDPGVQGKTLAEIAAAGKESPEEALADLLARSGFEVSAFNFSQDAGVVKQVLERPYAAIGSDSIADGMAYPHPRAFGSFPRLIRRELDKNDPESFNRWIGRVTTETAEFFGLAGRGAVREGYYADLALFDPARLEEAADYRHPAVLSRGMVWVFVNGRPVIAEGRATGLEPGRILPSQTA